MRVQLRQGWLYKNILNVTVSMFLVMGALFLISSTCTGQRKKAQSFGQVRLQICSPMKSFEDQATSVSKLSFTNKSDLCLLIWDIIDCSDPKLFTHYVGIEESLLDKEIICQFYSHHIPNNTLLKPKRHSLRCHVFMVHVLLLRMCTNVVDFRVMRRLCRREWNWQSVNQHSWDPWQWTKWSRRVTSDFNSVLSHHFKSFTLSLAHSATLCEGGVTRINIKPLVPMP